MQPQTQREEPGQGAGGGGGAEAPPVSRESRRSVVPACGLEDRSGGRI